MVSALEFDFHSALRSPRPIPPHIQSRGRHCPADELRKACVAGVAGAGEAWCGDAALEHARRLKRALDEDDFEKLLRPLADLTGHEAQRGRNPALLNPDCPRSGHLSEW